MSEPVYLHGVTEVQDKSKINAIETLCPACSMCCNGVLFADVRLQKKDNPALIRKLGLRVEKHGASLRFHQPCAALQNGLCRIYQERPGRCRAFECRVLKNVSSGNLLPAAALKMIQKTRKKAAKVSSLLERLGNGSTDQSLSYRYEEVMSQPWDLSAGQEFIKLRAALMREMSQLMQLVQEEFLT